MSEKIKGASRSFIAQGWLVRLLLEGYFCFVCHLHNYLDEYDVLAS
ncbi:hypothetical protein [Parageobacillus genomosp. 1]|nr:hypothetical protein [Parageobacillus genomosp. 1]